MDNHIYAIVLENEIIEVVHVERGDRALGNCQAYAQRLTETKQGIATVGIFQPLTKLEQIKIAKNKHKTAIS